MKKKITAIEVMQLLDKEQNATKKEQMEAYMRHQFPFLGIQTPQRRALTKPFLYQYKTNDPIDWEAVMMLWNHPYREYQYVACDLLRRQKRRLCFADIEKLKILALNKSWWDTVDVIDVLIGEIGLNDPRVENVMLQWSQADSIWLRRIAIDHQRLYKEKTNKALLTQIIANNFHTDEFFINKAIGWSLREYSKTNPQFVQQFVADHQKELSALSYRESLKYIKKRD